MQRKKKEMGNEGINRIKEAGLKMTPQRRAVYEAMTELRHASIEEIIESVQAKDGEVTVSTIYRILDTFCAANVLSFIYHPETGKCYYDITVEEHHHLFDGKRIIDYADRDLSRLIRDYLASRNYDPDKIGKIQVQFTVKNKV